KKKKKKKKAKLVWAPIAIGTDIGGSLRSPANFCGIMAHKCSSKRVMGAGKEGISGGNYWGKPTVKGVVGPLSRYVDDLVAVMKVLYSPQGFELDPHLPPIVFRDEIYNSTKKLKVAYLINDGYFTPVATVQRAVKETIAYVKNELKYEVVNLEEVLLRRQEVFEPYSSLGEIATMKYFEYAGAPGNMSDYIDALKGEYLMPGFSETYKGSLIPNFLRPLISKILYLNGEEKKAKIVAESYVRFSNEEKKKKKKYKNKNKNKNVRRGGVSVKKERQINYDIDQFRYRFWQMMNEENIDLIISPVNAFPALPIHFSSHFLNCLSHQMLQNVLDTASCAIGPVAFVRENEACYSVADLPRFEQNRSTRILAEYMKGLQGMPVGLQVWGKPFDDELVFRLCKELENIVQKY
ncbi:fatty-acid amide hydrolase 1, partial [Reticulomyxa filosa]